MKNYVRDDCRIPLVAPAGGVVSGNGYLIGDLFVVAEVSVAAGASFTGLLEGVVTLPKAAQAVTQGQALYWDGTNSVVTTTVGSNKKIGHAAAAQASGDATVQLRMQQS